MAVTVEVDGWECTVTMTDFRDGGRSAAAAAKQAARMLAQARKEEGGEPR